MGVVIVVVLLMMMMMVIDALFLAQTARWSRPSRRPTRGDQAVTREVKSLHFPGHRLGAAQRVATRR